MPRVLPSGVSASRSDDGKGLSPLRWSGVRPKPLPPGASTISVFYEDPGTGALPRIGLAARDRTGVFVAPASGGKPQASECRGDVPFWGL
jgi:hypothetical protein